MGKTGIAFSFLVLIVTGLAFAIERSVLGGGGLQGKNLDPMYRMFGSAKEAIGDALFLKADSYFHGGVEDRGEESPEDHLKEGLIESDHSGHEGAKDWIERVNEKIRSHEHYHLEGEERKEMLPFVAWASALDPYNVEAVLTAASWLDVSFGKTEEALSVLEKGALDNPRSWEIESALGGIYFNRKKDYARSRAHFESALLKIGAEASVHDRIYIHYHLAEDYRKLGETSKALEAYRRAFELFGASDTIPLKKIIAQKMESLQSAS